MLISDPRHIVWKLITGAILMVFLAFLLSPWCGIYQKFEPRDIITLIAAFLAYLGVEIPLSMAKNSKWKGDVQEALETEPPK